MSTYGIYEPLYLKGQKGEQGSVGPQGNQGPIGASGADGREGTQGRQGRQGLVGPKGDQGPIGNQGDQGIQGNQGIKGATGSFGPTGVTGPVGPNQGNYIYTYSNYSLERNLTYKVWRQDDVDINFDFNNLLSYNTDNQGYAYMIPPGNNDNSYLDKCLMNFDSGTNFDKLVQLGLQSSYFIPLGYQSLCNGYINNVRVSLISDSISKNNPNELAYLIDNNVYLGYRISLEIHSPIYGKNNANNLNTWPKYTRKRTFVHDKVENKLLNEIQFIETNTDFKGYNNNLYDNDWRDYRFTIETGKNDNDIKPIMVNSDDYICLGFTPIYANKSSNFVSVKPNDQIIKRNWNDYLKLKSINLSLNLIKI